MQAASLELESEQDFLDGLTTFVDRYVVPLEGANQEVLDNPRQLYTDNGAYSDRVVDLLREVRRASSSAGYFTAFVPRDVGGAGLGILTSYRAWETLHHRYGPGRLLPYQVISHWTSGPSFLISHLCPRLQETVGQELLHGDMSVCFAMSEPEAGSDAWSMQTRAVQKGSAWVINGSKQWISNSPYAKYAFVFAVTDDERRKQKQGGISCFLVPMATPGVQIDRVIKLYGHIGGNESVLGFSDVEVPVDHLVGELDNGFALAMAGVSEGRMYNAGRCVGLAQWALEEAVDYAKSRKAFGSAIANYQGVSFKLADSAIDIYAAKHMSEHCASLLDAGHPAVKELAMVKAFTTEMCCEVYDRCMQVFGGMGLTNETRLYDGWQQARTVRIADGSGEIMRRTIANKLLRGDTKL